MPSISITRWFPTALVAVCLAAVLAGGALAATSGAQAPGAPTAVTLKVKGTFVKRTARFCHKAKKVRVFGARTALKYKGLVTPAPAKHFPVLVQVKRCAGRRFRTVARYAFQGKRATGVFKAFFRAPRVRRHQTVYFFARAVVGGVRSKKVYFAVRG
jgi:hypothetical protein